jgi:hypothetical protein
VRKAGGGSAVGDGVGYGRLSGGVGGAGGGSTLSRGAGVSLGQDFAFEPIQQPHQKPEYGHSFTCEGRKGLSKRQREMGSTVCGCEYVCMCKPSRWGIRFQRARHTTGRRGREGKAATEERARGSKTSEGSWRRLSRWYTRWVEGVYLVELGAQEEGARCLEERRFPWTGLRFRASSAASSKAGVRPQLHVRREKGTEQAAAGDGE